MPDWLITLIVTIIGGLLILFVEYFVLKPGPTERKKILVSAALAVCLFAPLFIFQFFTAQIIAATIRQLPEVVRVDWYANLYAVSAMAWGWLWGTKARAWLGERIEGVVDRWQTKPPQKP